MDIEVAAEAFGPDGDRGWHEHVIITGAADPGAAAAALSRAGDRFYRVTDDGREPSEQAWLEEQALATGAALPYTPNWVSEVRLAPRGPWCYVDCKGYIPLAMRARMIAILIEELEHAGGERPHWGALRRRAGLRHAADVPHAQARPMIGGDAAQPFA